MILSLSDKIRGNRWFDLFTRHIATKIIVNTDPTFSSLVTCTVPPICSTIDLQMLSPSPLPV